MPFLCVFLFYYGLIFEIALKIHLLFSPYIAHERTAQNLIFCQFARRSLLFFSLSAIAPNNQGLLKSEERFQRAMCPALPLKGLQHGIFIHTFSYSKALDSPPNIFEFGHYFEEKQLYLQFCHPRWSTAYFFQCLCLYSCFSIPELSKCYCIYIARSEICRS